MNEEYRETRDRLIRLETINDQQVDMLTEIRTAMKEFDHNCELRRSHIISRIGAAEKEIESIKTINRVLAGLSIILATALGSVLAMFGYGGD